MQPMARKQTITKQKGDMKSLKKMIMYFKPYFPAIIIALIFAIAGAICTIIGPEKISDLMTLIQKGIMTGIDMTAVLDIAITLVILYCASAILTYSQQFIMATVTQKTSKKLRKNINKKINKLPLSYFDKTTKGDILSRVTNDVDTISQTLGSAIANLVSALALFIGVIFKMFQTNAVLAITTILSSLVGFVFMGLILGKSQKHFNHKQSQLGEMNGQIEEVYTNQVIVKSFNAEDNEIKDFENVNNRLYTSNWKSQFLSGLMMPIMNFVGNLCYVMIFIVGVSFIVNGNTTVGIGTLLAFTIYARLFSQPLATFAQNMSSLQQASAASKRVFEMLDEPEMEDETHKNTRLSDVKGNVNFKNVEFEYIVNQPIIKNFNIDIKAGQKVAIVGPTGAGKTTIVNLLMRFYELSSGDITIDNVSVKDMKREEVHNLFDMILQDTWLFKGTIRENLVYNKENVSDEDLDRACKAVGIYHYISTLPQGYDTYLDDSANLSEGQKQQLTIARAMIKDAPLLILDEATSNVDTRTELIIQNAMDKLTENRTSFVIAHRLSTIRNADIILVMRNGDIIETGNHKELLERNGFYSELYNSQFETYGAIAD